MFAKSPPVATFALLAAIGVVAASTASPAQAKTDKCRAGKYLAGIDQSDLRVSALRAQGLPRKTDGYAPPCLVADAAASQVQAGAYSKLPTKLRLGGARWDGGTWTCSYAGEDGTADRRATCVKRGAGSQRITMTLTAD